jgi:dTDP-4-amino-4,6-dideoxygalactose transaminase
VRVLRTYGWRGSERSSTVVGVNSRLQEIQAGILSVLLPHLDSGTAERARIASHYRQALGPLAVAGRIGLPPEAEGAAYHQFAIEVSDRDGVRERLARMGVGTGVHYAVPVHRQPAFAPYLPPEASLPVTDALAGRLVSLPIQPEVVGEAAGEIAGRVIDAVSASRGWA